MAKKKKKEIFHLSEGIKPSKVKPGRTKKDPIIVEGYILNDFFSEPIKLTVKASPEDWEKLQKSIIDNPSWFAQQFESSFVYSALQEKNKKRLSGKHKATYHIVNEIKITSGILYAYFLYWLKKGENEWPDHLKKLKDLAIEDRHKDIFFTKSDKPQRLTEYCIEKFYREILQRLKEEKPLSEYATFLEKYKDKPTEEAIKQFSNSGLNPFKDLFSFYQTYIQVDGRPTRFSKQFIQGKTPKEVAILAVTIPALSDIFRHLKII